MTPVCPPLETDSGTKSGGPFSPGPFLHSMIETLVLATLDLKLLLGNLVPLNRQPFPQQSVLSFFVNPNYEQNLPKLRTN